MNKNKIKEYSIDAKNQSLGRVASKTASILRGKNFPDFYPNVAPTVKVKISNLSKIKFTGNKFEKKTYKRYSGHPGGLKTIPFKLLFKTKPEYCFKKSVEGMLPHNKLRKVMLRNIFFE